MKIIETTIFTKRLKTFLQDEEYRNLQNELILNPGKGKIIRESGGLRKTRWSIPGRGKRGGVRIIYYWLNKKETILMLLIYSKKDQDDLTSKQLKILKTLVEKELR
jgi:mRNA-degrading endonuclease RelE of RelBE toxin-antitoxin system